MQSVLYLSLLLLGGTRLATSRPQAPWQQWCEKIPTNPWAAEIPAQYLQIPGCDGSTVASGGARDSVGANVGANVAADTTSSLVAAATHSSNPGSQGVGIQQAAGSSKGSEEKIGGGLDSGNSAGAGANGGPGASSVSINAAVATNSASANANTGNTNTGNTNTGTNPGTNTGTFTGNTSSGDTGNNTNTANITATGSSGSAGSGAIGPSWHSSFTSYGLGDDGGSPDCTVDEGACQDKPQSGFTAALSQFLYLNYNGGSGVSGQPGPACGTCWRIQADENNSGGAISTPSIVVMITNECPANSPLCGMTSATDTNDLKANINIDLCIQSGAAPTFWGKAVSDGTGQATPVDCSEWCGVYKNGTKSGGDNCSGATR